MNCCVVPSGIDALEGATVIDVSTAGEIVKFAVPLTFPLLALMTTLPTATLWASPVASTVATVASPELQSAVLVRSFVLESV